MRVTFEFNLEQEMAERAAWMATLKQTEGWEKLTEKQKKMMELSLYVQQRAERGTDLASLNAIEHPQTHAATDVVRIKHPSDLGLHREDGSLKDLGVRGYGVSQDNVALFMCFAAVAALEGQELRNLPYELGDDFFDGDYFVVEDEEGLIKRIEEIGFPCVLFANVMKDFQGLFFVRHACVVMGRDGNGRTVIWEKEVDQLPYQVTSLDKVFGKYSKDHNWGVRRLRSTIDNVID